MSEWNDLVAFCNNHNILYLYGAGKNQIRMREGFDAFGIGINALVVSDDHYMVMDGVKKLSDVKDDLENASAGILIGVDNKYYNEIFRNIAVSMQNLPDFYIITPYEKDILIKKGLNIEGRRYKDIKEIDEYYEYYKYIQEKCKPDEYNLLCHLHLGDTIALLGLNDIFKEKYGKAPHYLVSKTQEILVSLYDGINYSVVEPLKLEGSVLDDLTYDQIEEFRQNLYEKIFPAVPQKGAPFVAAPVEYIKNQKSWINFVDGWSRMLGLESTKIKAPKLPDKICDSLINKIKTGIDVHKICLFAPELKSFRGPSKEYWEELADKLRNEGYYVVTNVIHSENRIPNTLNIDMTLQELISLAGSCHSIYSARSGLCDCVVSRGERLHVFYPPEMDLKYFSLNSNFIINSDVFEQYILEQ